MLRYVAAPKGRGIESVRIFYPSDTPYKIQCALASCTTSTVLCNLFKERFFLRVSGSAFPKADAKVLLFHELTK